MRKKIRLHHNKKQMEPIFIVIIVALLLMWLNQHSQRETYNTDGSAVVSNTKRSVLDRQSLNPPRTSGLGASPASFLFTEPVYQGRQIEIDQGEEVEFMRQVPTRLGVNRLWKYKSLRKDPYIVAKFTAYIARTQTEPEEKLVVYAEPRFGSIENIDLYLKDDPKLALKSGLAYGANDREITYTLTLS